MEIEVLYYVKDCPVCHGSGYIMTRNDTEPQVCCQCDGEGSVQVQVKCNPLKPTKRELINNSYIFPRHKCCELAEIYLFPPNKRVPLTKIDEGGIMAISATDFWYIKFSDDGPRVPVKYCPWCPLELMR